MSDVKVLMEKRIVKYFEYSTLRRCLKGLIMLPTGVSGIISQRGNPFVNGAMDWYPLHPHPSNVGSSVIFLLDSSLRNTD